jgi:hypothetical protein
MFDEGGFYRKMRRKQGAVMDPTRAIVAISGSLLVVFIK